MSFALPWALSFLALFVPVILLYMLKQRRQPVRVSSLRFWERILQDEQRVASYTRIRKLLSLLLQLLLIALLTFALARPIFSKELLGARRIVVLLDNSASMTAEEGGETRFDQAIAHARDAVRGMAYGDTMMIVAFSDAPDVLIPFTSSRTALRNALDAVEVTHNRTDLGAALALLDALPPSTRKTHVYLISDGACEPVDFTPPPEMSFAYLPVGEAEENAGFTALQARPLPGAPRDFEVYFEVRNFGDQELRAPYELRAGTRLLDAGELVIEAGGRDTRMLRQYAPGGGVLTLFLDHEDAFPLDNTAYTVLPANRPVRVALVTPGNLFLEQALRTDPGIELEVYAPAAYRAVLAGTLALPADVYVFDRCIVPPPEKAPSIHLAAWPPDLRLAVAGDPEERIITSWDREHRVMRHLNLENVNVRGALTVTAPPDYVVLAESFGDPLILLRETREGARLVFAFDSTVSDLPLRAAFPMLMANSVRFLAGAGAQETWQTHATGDVVSASEMARHLVGSASTGSASVPASTGRASVRDPVVRILAPGETPPEDTTPAAALDPTPWLAARAGVYTGLTRAGATRPLFAANLADARESRIAPSPDIPVTDATALPVLEAGFRLGVEPYYFLLLLAVLLLCAEWVLFHRRIVE